MSIIKFDLQTDFKMNSDQEKVVNTLSKGINNNLKYQVLKGVTGSGKTFSMANIINKVNKPTLILCHNKTLAAQLYSEMKELFPNNAVEYFVSHYKSFQPEAYLPATDQYIEKTASINWEIERLRQKTVVSLCTRKDVIVVASVSALFGLGDPYDFIESSYTIKVNEHYNYSELLIEFIKRQYERTNDTLTAGKFKACGDNIYIMLSTDKDIYYRISMFDDEIENIYKVSYETDKVLESLSQLIIFPISTYYLKQDRQNILCDCIKTELDEVYLNFLKNGEKLYAERIYSRCMYDIEQIRELGYVNNIEVYQRYLSNRKPGEPPFTLMDFFPKDYLMFIDESHVTLPQVKSISNQGSSIKYNLIRYGWRLPSVIDNRPINFDEFVQKHNQVIFVSATPGDYELKMSKNTVEQLIRPTGLLDPYIEVKPIKGQIDYIISECNKTINENHGKILISVLTKKMAEQLTDYLWDVDIKVAYLHSEVATLDRINILNDFQKGRYDVLIGCNLLREGLSLADCQVVMILDADKEGFLRNYSSLMQTIGRAARNTKGKAILFCDKITKSIQKVIDETNYHRKVQSEYNEKYHITPQNVKRKLINNIIQNENLNEFENDFEDYSKFSKSEIKNKIKEYTDKMYEAAKDENFELAIVYRDELEKLEKLSK